MNHHDSGIPMMIFITAAGAFNVVAQAATEMNGAGLAQLLRELGSFGLVAFVVWWYATRIAPNSEKRYLEAIAQARTDYLAAADKQRADYLAGRAQDRVEQQSLTIAVTHLIEAMTEHTTQANAVWRLRGELPYEDGK